MHTHGGSAEMSARLFFINGGFDSLVSHYLLASRAHPCCCGVMAKPMVIELPDGTEIPILYEDRAVMAIDKPAGWMLAPDSWVNTSRNLQLALVSSITAGDFWARSRNLKFLRFVHRLDADTSGVNLFVKHPSAMEAYSKLFREHEIEKKYLAVVTGTPKEQAWTCRLKLAERVDDSGRIHPDPVTGDEAETRFRVCASVEGLSLIEATPITGRTHQIRVHLADAGYPIVNDPLYGPKGSGDGSRLGLRSVFLKYVDPFQNRPIFIKCPIERFCLDWGFDADAVLAIWKAEGLKRRESEGNHASGSFAGPGTSGKPSTARGGPAKTPPKTKKPPASAA